MARLPRFRPLLRALESRLVPTTYTVLNSADDGPDSLRACIVAANGNAGADSIVFNSTAFASAQTITLTTGALGITDALTITGPAAGVTVSGGGTSQVFVTTSAPTSTAITLAGLTVTGGSAATGAGVAVGDESVTLSNCTVVGNTATSRGGGADLSLSAGVLTITACTFSDNSAPAGGGVASLGTLTVDRSTFIGNKSTFGSSGGAVRALGAGNLTVINSTLTQNSANSNGGGIGFSGFSGIALIRNCTIVGNTAGGSGQGGGVGVNTGSTGSVTIESSVVSGNTASTSAIDLFSGGTITAKFSALGSTAGVTTLTADVTTTSLVGQNFKLGPLAGNGGPTLTMLPALDSPLISKGSNPAANNTDQRGAGYGRVRTAVDIGAVEATTNFIVVNDLSSGLGSLRQAVADSNAFTGTDTIQFDAAAFALTDTTITLTGGTMFISDSVDIHGPGASLATVSGAGGGRIFQIFSGAGRTVNLSGLTLADASVGAAGGAITCAANLVVQDCAFRNNTAATGEGGAINMENSGPYSLSIDRCSFTGNVGQLGGAVNFPALASLFVTNSTFAANRSLSTGGGALRIFSGGPIGLLVRNCTFSGNTAATVGGAIELSSFSGTLSVRNSTIVNNSAATNGGGIGAFSTSPQILMESNIISGNLAGGTGPDIFNTGTVNAKTCLIGTRAGVAVFLSDLQTIALEGQAPLLGPLADNGGPTATHALTALSPAVDAGSNPAAVLASDQRGSGFDRTSGKGTDIGAYELQIATVTSATFNAGAVQRSRVDRLDVTFSRVVSLPGTPESAFQLVRQSDSAIVAMKATVTNTPTTSVAFSFTGGPLEFGSLADGRYTLQISSGLVGGGNVLLDGNGDGTGGDSYLLIGNPTNKLFRLYGDVDGTGTIDADDLLAFRLAFLTASPALDFDNSGQVSGADFLAFRLRYLVTV